MVDWGVKNSLSAKELYFYHIRSLPAGDPRSEAVLRK